MSPFSSTSRFPRRELLAWAAVALAVTGSVCAPAQEFQLGYDLNKNAGSAIDAPALKAFGKTAADNFGQVIRSGDINGDGIDDLIIGTPNADVGSPVRVDAGAVYVWFGKTAIGGAKDVNATAGTPPDVTIMGASEGDSLTRDGALVVFDINGDGVLDLLMGSLLADGPADARPGAGEAYIVYGRTAEESFPAVIDLAVQGASGANATFFGAANDDQLTIGGAMAVGDVNGDGRNDILLGSVLADGPGDARPSAGEAYVILGKSGASLFPATVDLSVSGAGGVDVTIYGATTGDFLTFGGAIGVGDVNEDGLLDIMLGARDADGPDESRSSAGEAYLVFGRATFPATLDLAIQGTGGADVTIYGASAQDQLTSGGTLAVGDVNGDGRADLLLGAPGGDGPNESRVAAGEAYIISGREVFPHTLDLAVHGVNGASATIYGASVQDQLTSGGSLAVGDVNGDGFTDLLLGAPLADGPGEARTSAGEAYIILGGASFAEVVDLNPTTGDDHADVTIYGASVNDNLTIEGALAVGDVDGDGAADLLLGARLADGPLEGRNNAGEAYIVLGRNPFPSTIDLATQGLGGADVTVYGATGGQLTSMQDQLTSSAALGAGDVNGDGFADFIVGAIGADGPAEDRAEAGEAYVIFGTGSLSIAPDIAVEQPAGTNIPDGGSRFGSILIGASTTRTFTIRNTGVEILTDLALTADGANSDEYELGSLPATSLLPGASLTFNVTFTPSSIGARVATLHIASNDPNENPFDIVMTGNGTAPELDVEQPVGTALASGGTQSFGTMHTGGQAVMTFALKNTGSADLLNVSVTKDGDQASEFVITPPAGSTVAAGSTLNLTVAFAPTGLGTRNARLLIASNDADENPYIINVTGIGKLPAPEITVEQPAAADRQDNALVDFGFITVGLTNKLTFVVKNTGSATLSGLELSTSGDNVDEYAFGSLGSTSLVPGASTTFDVTFAPQAAGPRLAAVEIASNDEDENPFHLSFSGTGMDPEIALEEPEGTELPDGDVRAFGDVLVGQGTSRTVTIRNTGTTNLTGLGLTKSGAAANDFVLNGLTTDTVTPGGSTTFTITFAPTARGTRTAIVHLANNDGDEDPYDIAVSGNGLAPEIDVAGPGDADLVDGGAAVDVGGVVIESATAARTFVIHNNGNSNLNGLQTSITGGDSGDFQITQPTESTLAPGDSASFTVVFAPAAVGAKSGVIHIANDDGDESPFDIAITATAYAKEPAFPAQQLHRWYYVGEAMTLDLFITGSDPKTYQWYKNGAKLSGAAAKAASLLIAKPKTTDAAIYRVAVSNAFVTAPVTSPDCYIGMVTRAPSSITLNQNATLNLSCPAAVPAGAGLSYRWSRNDTPLSEGGRYSGTQSKSLKVTNILPNEAGNYECRVTMSVNAVPFIGTGGATSVTVVEKPSIDTFTLDDAYVGQEIAFSVPTQHNPTSFTASGLPAGVTISKTGLICGKPKGAKVVKGSVVPYVIKLTAGNSAGKSAQVTVNWKILPLDPGAIGTFNGLMSRNAVFNGSLGGTLKIVTTSSGGFSGALKTGAQSYALTGSLTTPAGGGNPTGSAVLKRKAPLLPATLTWTIDLGTGRLSGSVAAEGADATEVVAWRTPWSSSNKATAYAAGYNAALSPNAASMEQPALCPEGEGYALLKVAATGTATWSGKLADGSGITGATTVGPNGEVPLQVTLYAGSGSAQGWSVVSPNGDWDSDGVIDWYKAQQPAKSATRSFKAGIPLHELILTGCKYVKPTGIVLGLAGGPNNGSVTFAGGGLTDELEQTFTVSDKNAVAIAKAGEENPAAVKVALAAATGLLSGSFTLVDPDPLDVTEPIAVLKRTAPWNGVLVPRLGRGAGFFLLQKLPAVTGETLTKTEILSGDVVVGVPAPPP